MTCAVTQKSLAPSPCDELSLELGLRCSHIDDPVGKQWSRYFPGCRQGVSPMCSPFPFQRDANESFSPRFARHIEATESGILVVVAGCIILIASIPFVVFVYIRRRRSPFEQDIEDADEEWPTPESHPEPPLRSPSDKVYNSIPPNRPWLPSIRRIRLPPTPSPTKYINLPLPRPPSVVENGTRPQPPIPLPPATHELSRIPTITQSMLSAVGSDKATKRKVQIPPRALIAPRQYHRSMMLRIEIPSPNLFSSHITEVSFRSYASTPVGQSRIRLSELPFVNAAARERGERAAASITRTNGYLVPVTPLRIRKKFPSSASNNSGRAQTTPRKSQKPLPKLPDTSDIKSRVWTEGIEPMYT